MPDVRTEWGCPTCREAGVKGQIVAVGGARLVCSTNSNHFWTDSMEFMKLRPRMEFAAPAPIVSQQTGYTKVEVQIPINHAQTLSAKLGAQFNSTVAGILSMLAEGEVMIVPAGDLQRIKQLLGQTPQSSSELFGLIYALDLREKEAKADAEAAQKEVAAYEGLNKALVVVNLGDQRENAAEKAKSEGLPLKLYIERNLINALQNNWF